MGITPDFISITLRNKSPDYFKFILIPLLVVNCRIKPGRKTFISITNSNLGKIKTLIIPMETFAFPAFLVLLNSIIPIDIKSFCHHHPTICLEDI